MASGECSPDGRRSSNNFIPAKQGRKKNGWEEGEEKFSNQDVDDISNAFSLSTPPFGEARDDKVGKRHIVLQFYAPFCRPSI